MGVEYNRWLNRLNDLDISSDNYKRLFAEIKAHKTDSESSESYLDFVLSLPWGDEPQHQIDLIKAKREFDQLILGHEKIKKILLDQMALENHLGKSMGKVLLLNGPSGTGKTYIAQCFAKISGKLFYPMRLGGVQDTTSILGTSKGYKNARSSYLIEFIAKHKTKNLVVLLDEIDKVDTKNAMVQHALLQLTDRTTGFVDSYVDLPFDISSITFIATSNDITQISPALKDRFNCIDVPDFTEVELQQIMVNYLIPLKMEAYRLDPNTFRIEDQALILMNSWCQLKSIRKLNQNIETLFAHAVRNFLENGVGLISKNTVIEAFAYDQVKVKIESFEALH